MGKPRLVPVESNKLAQGVKRMQELDRAVRHHKITKERAKEEKSKIKRWLGHKH